MGKSVTAVQTLFFPAAPAKDAARLAGRRSFHYINQTPTVKRSLSILKHDSTGPFDVTALKDLIVSSLDDDKGVDIQVIDLSGQSALADYIVVASGTSSRHITAMAEKMRERLIARGTKDIRTEGLAHANWVVLDAGDVIVHLFRPEVREFYNIEKMWSVPESGGSSKSGGLNRL